MKDPLRDETLATIGLYNLTEAVEQELAPLLEAHGHRVCRASNLDVAAGVDLVLVGLGGKDRVPWLHCRGCRAADPTVRVVAVPESEDDAAHEQLLEVADSSLVRPFTESAVLERIRQEIERRADRRALGAAESKLRGLVEQSLTGIYMIQGDRFVYANPRFAEIFGYTVEEVVTQCSIAELIAPPDRARVERTLQRRLTGDLKSVQHSFRGLRKGGEVIEIEVHGTVAELEGRVALVGTLLDVTRRKRMEEALQQSERYFRSLIENAQDIITIVDRSGTVVYESPSVERILGHPAEELIGHSVMEFIHPEDLARVQTELESIVAETGAVRTVVCRFRDAAGSWRVLEATARNLLDDPAVNGIVINSRDVSDSAIAEEELRENEERFRLMVEGSEQVFFYVHDPEHRFEYLSPSVEAVLGFEPKELLGEPYDRLLTGDPSDEEVRQLTTQTLATGVRSGSYTAHVRHKDGRAVVLEVVEGPVTRGGEVVGIRGFARDVTERVQAEEALRTSALRDPLTGLPNRILFLERLSHALARARRNRAHHFAVLFLDLDRFKVVNDSLGHEVGDELLGVVAGRLERCLRPEDTVARFGGDEFTILVEGIASSSDVTKIARRILSEVAAPISLGGYEVFTSVSIGIALNSSAYDRPEHLLRNADMAMYRAKSAGAPHYEIFDRKMHAEALVRLQLETDLRRALDRGEFVLQYQPIIDLASRRILGFEALIRWNHPERGIIPPNDFIPIAEETGLIIPLGLWVLRTACQKLAEWQEGRTEQISMSVNLSPKQFSQADLVRQVRAALRETGTAAGALRLEITEGAVIGNTQLATRTLAALKTLGVQLYIDDFGTGYSSLSYLHRLPLDGLKVDRSFVRDMANDQRQAHLVRTILLLAESLGVSAVAEGVETNAQLDRLKELGCLFGQGYLFSKPVDEGRALELLGVEAADVKEF